MPRRCPSHTLCACVVERNCRYNFASVSEVSAPSWLPASFVNVHNIQVVGSQVENKLQPRLLKVLHQLLLRWQSKCQWESRLRGLMLVRRDAAGCKYQSKQTLLGVKNNNNSGDSSNRRAPSGKDNENITVTSQIVCVDLRVHWSHSVYTCAFTLWVWYVTDKCVHLLDCSLLQLWRHKFAWTFWIVCYSLWPRTM